MKRIALLGMPNTGKSTFFNRLTGARARVGNWPGITVSLSNARVKLNGREVEFVDLRFVDMRGIEQHVTFPVGIVDASLFEDGKMFDGSSISGWKGINESDMVLLPDPTSAYIDPFYADPTLVLTFFAVVTLGFALPAAPGGMGVFEASAVVALGWFGVDRERAFAVGLALHMLQYIPVTLAGLWVLAASGLSLTDLRRQADKPGL